MVMKFICSICGYVYDEAREAVHFVELPESWTCPLCGAAKSAFKPEQSVEQTTQVSVAPIAVDTREAALSAGEWSALCSNLARGCAQQYKDEEAALYRELAAYFDAAVPPPETARAEELAVLLGVDLAARYPALRQEAVADGDRGTQRICVWGEKVTTMQQNLVERLLNEGSEFLADTSVWVCGVCGFIYVGAEAPALCPVCKVPPWKFEKIEGRAAQ